MPSTVYVSIGNSDDKLTQAEWAEYVAAVESVLSVWAKIHGTWSSASTSPYQNACWCCEIHADQYDLVKTTLTTLRKNFSQDGIAWAIAETHFI